MERVFQRNLNELEKVFRFIESDLASRNVGERTAYAVRFVVEELFTNMVKYNKASKGAITLRLRQSSEAYEVEMIDDDVEMFDVTKPPAVDIDKPIEEREPGGLGIYLINKIVDSIEYTYADRQSRIVFSKRLE